VPSREATRAQPGGDPRPAGRRPTPGREEIYAREENLVAITEMELAPGGRVTAAEGELQISGYLL